MIQLVILGVAATVARISATNGQVTGGMTDGIENVAKYGIEVLRRHSSGRPGPNVVTGDFRASHDYVILATGEMADAALFTNQDQALRLEFGFRGTDSLGRSYDQPPYPTYQPALGEISRFMEFTVGNAISARLGT